MTLEQKVQFLLDERDIRDVIYRECRGKNRADADLLRSCYWEDAEDHHPPFFDAKMSEYADFIPQGIKQIGPVVQYIAQQILIDLDGDVARVETYVRSNKLFHQRTDEGHEIIRISGMRMLDRFERRDGEWRIAERWFIPEWGFFVEQPALEKAISAYGVGTTGSHVACDPTMTAIPHSFDRTDLSYNIPGRIK